MQCISCGTVSVIMEVIYTRIDSCSRSSCPRACVREGADDHFRARECPASVMARVGDGYAFAVLIEIAKKGEE